MPWQSIHPTMRTKDMAVHAVLLPRGSHGEILYFGGYGVDDTHLFDVEPPYSESSIVDIAAADSPSGQQTAPNYNMFCAGHAVLNDGRLLVAGGQLPSAEHEPGEPDPGGAGGGHPHGNMAGGGERRCAIVDPLVPNSDLWLFASPMSLAPDGQVNSGGRWYPTLVTLANGEVLATGGHPDVREEYPLGSGNGRRHCNSVNERYTPWTNEWTLLATDPPGAEQLTAVDADTAFDYHRTFLLPDGRVFFASPVRGQNRVYDPYAGSFSTASRDVITLPTEATYQGGPSAAWTAVMLPLLHQEGFRPRVLLTNGTAAQRIDLGVSGTPAWESVARDWSGTSRGNPPPFRLNGLAVMLPTGEVLLVGGVHSTPPLAPEDKSAVVNQPEVYQPRIDWATGAYLPPVSDPAATWAVLESETAVAARHYHSVALLMPNGNVWTAGSNPPTGEADGEDYRVEIYEPWYAAETRPVIDEVQGEPMPAGAPEALKARLTYGERFTVVTAQAADISRVVLLRCGSVTHAYNPDQRYLSLDFAERDGALSVSCPPNGNVAPPGYYLVWLIDSAGVPCEEGKFVLLSHRRCVLHTDRSELSRDEVEALKAQEGGLLPWSILVRLEGFAPSQVGVSDPSQLGSPSEAELAAFAPRVELDLPAELGTISATPYKIEPEDATTIDQPQRLVFWYRLDVNGLTLPDDPGFFEPVTLQARPPAALDQGLYLCAGTFIFKAVATPYLLDGATPWLSTDLRVFTRSVADAGNPNAFIAGLMDEYNESNAVPHPFDALSEDPEVSQLFISGNDNEQRPVYNFAVARVRYRASTDLEAGAARVFFRMFDWQTTSMEFDENTTYRQVNDAAPLLGFGPDNGNEVVSIPFFSVARIGTASPETGSMVNQSPDPAPSFEGNQLEVRRYYGAWLDFNQTTRRFPRSLASAGDNGPYANAVSIMELVRNDHPCIVAEIVVATDNIEPGATPEGSERLAQRNITIVSSNNPGWPAAHTVQTTFDVKLSQHHPTSPGLSTHAAGPDELVFSLSELPAGTTASLYLPGVSASEVLRLSAAHGGRIYPLIDEHTIALAAGGAVYLALPGDPGDRIAGLLTVTLPEGVSVGQTYRVVARQLSHRRQRVEGTFELLIPVKTVADNVRIDGRRLSIWRHIFSTMPTTDRAYPIFVRLIKQLEDRLTAVGVDPGLVKPSPAGDGLFRPTFEESPITGNGEVLLSDRVRVLTQSGGFAPVFNSGLLQLNVGVETDVGHLVARGLVFVRDRGRVHGFLRTSGQLQQQNATQIDGPIVLGGTVFLPQLAFTVAFPGATVGNVNLEPDQTGSAVPGYYGQVTVKSRATLTLTAGTYFCNELTIEPQAQVVLNAAQGPIYIWVRDSLTFRGAFNDSAGAFPNVLVGFMGSGTAVVDSAYRGTLLAPNGKINLATVALPGHVGSFHGKNVEVHPQTTVSHRPFGVPIQSIPGTVWPPAG
jgi:hypothetical protein